MNRSERDELGLRLSAYLDGEADAGERAALEALLRDSAEARSLLTDLRSVSGAVAGLEKRSPPRDLAAMVRSAAERRELLGAPGAGWRLTWQIARIGSAAVVLLVCTWAGWRLYRLPDAITDAGASADDARIAIRQPDEPPSFGRERMEYAPEAFSLSSPSAELPVPTGVARDWTAESSPLSAKANDVGSRAATPAPARDARAAFADHDGAPAIEGESTPSTHEDELATAASRMLALQSQFDDDLQAAATDDEAIRLLAAADEPSIELVIRPRDTRERRAVERALLRWRLEGGERLGTIAADQEFVVDRGRVGTFLRAIADTGAPAGMRTEMDVALFVALARGGETEVESERIRDEAHDADPGGLLDSLRARLSGGAATSEPAAPKSVEESPPASRTSPGDDNLFLRMLRRQAEAAGIDVARWGPTGAEEPSSVAESSVRIRVRILD